MREQRWYKFRVGDKEWGDVCRCQDICKRIFCDVLISALSESASGLPHLAGRWRWQHYPHGKRIIVCAEFPPALRWPVEPAGMGHWY